MVHALQEAYRALRSDGLLVDMRPAPVHRRVSVVRPGRYHFVATMRENLASDRAAERAIASVLRQGLFELVRASRFDCRRTFDTVEEVRDWLEEPARHEWLLRKLQRSPELHRRGAIIVVRGPIIVRVLRKMDHSVQAL
jgi:hypothetical protein